MISQRGHRHPRRSAESGIGLAELLVYVVISGVVVATVFKLMIGQSRLYTQQRELMDVAETLRPADALLGWELRQASAAGGDLYTIGSSSVSLRSIQATGMVCVKNAAQVTYGLFGIAGDFAATSDDSALVSSRFNWKVVKVNQVGTGAALSVANCGWTVARASQEGIKVTVTQAADTSDIALGAPVRMFRRVTYGAYQDSNGRWWLGRKIGAASSYTKLTGPLQASGGLVFTYYNAAGSVTTDPKQVALIQVVLRGQSARKQRNGLGQVAYERDSLVTRVALRN